MWCSQHCCWSSWSLAHRVILHQSNHWQRSNKLFDDPIKWINIWLTKCFSTHGHTSHPREVQDIPVADEKTLLNVTFSMMSLTSEGTSHRSWLSCPIVSIFLRKSYVIRIDRSIIWRVYSKCNVHFVDLSTWIWSTNQPTLKTID